MRNHLIEQNQEMCGNKMTETENKEAAPSYCFSLQGGTRRYESTHFKLRIRQSFFVYLAELY